MTKSNHLKTVFLIVLFVVSLTSYSQDSTNGVLFVGNSLTKYKKNKMTDILKEFIKESNLELQIEVAAYDGSRLMHHTSMIQVSKNKSIGFGIDTLEATTMKTIINGNYDLIVLQDPEWMIKVKRELNIYPSVKFIASHTNSKLAFYQKVPTFIEPIKFCYGCTAKYSKHTPDSIKIEKEEIVFKTIEHQMDTIRAVGDELRSEIAPGSIIIPTGEIVNELHKKLPHVSMTIGGGHPSKIVQYALAVTFYTYITQKDPRELIYNFKLADGDAKLIRELVYNYSRKEK